MFKSFFNKFKRNPSPKPPRDPVCDMHATEGITLDYKGKSYYFCSDHCQQQFKKEPEAYITK